ncbi:MAG: DUF1080 domain-containing protein [Kiritimatiellae bacterium]|nr:DUF1080 domain-containing protein [Kiritimatiellia bacterium]
MTISTALLFAALYGDTPDAKHAWAVHDWNRPKPHKVEPGCCPGSAPSDAIRLFDGTRESFEKNWCADNGGETTWKYSEEGFFHPSQDWSGIRTRQSFGDCQLHVEYRHDPERIFDDQGPQMRGNSGVFLMGSYEIQVMESYWTSAEAEGTCEYVDNYADGQAAAVYAENPPMVNPARKPGEWQVYDIVFHQPVWDGETLLHPGSVTVFFNGVLVQDHWEMEGLSTHCTRRPLAPHATKLPFGLQDHGCHVEFRNIWLREIPSRWDNRTHSALAADEGEVMKLRRETAGKLFAKIADPSAGTAENVKALAEVVSYANEGEWAKAFAGALDAYRRNHGDAAETGDVNNALGVLVRNGIYGEEILIK